MVKTEKEKMLSGLPYNPMDKQLVEERKQARLLLKELNDLQDSEKKKRNHLLKQLMPAASAATWIQSPFYCDYGYNIRTGEQVFFNFNCVVLDVMPVTIGSRTMIGPAVQITRQIIRWITRSAPPELNQQSRCILVKTYG